MLLRYQNPTSWGDKGMNWSAPDPCKIDYWIALREAIKERCAATGRGVYSDKKIKFSIIDISPLLPPSYTWVEAIVKNIKSLLGNSDTFVDLDFDYKEDGSDFPHYITSNDLTDVKPNFLKTPPRGSPLKDFSGWMMACKRALDKLTVTGEMTRQTMLYDGYAIGTDEEQTKAINTAWEEIQGIIKGSTYYNEGFSFGCFARTIVRKTKVYVETGPYTAERKDGFQAEVEYQYAKMKHVKPLLCGATPKIVVAVVATDEDVKTVGTPVATNYQGGNFEVERYKKGVNIKKYSLEESEGDGIFIGELDNPPQGVPAVSEQGETAGAGYAGRVCVFLDYKQNGFKFF